MTGEVTSLRSYLVQDGLSQDGPDRRDVSGNTGTAVAGHPWDRIRAQARACQDPIMRALVQPGILAQPDFPSALAFLLARKLGNDLIDREAMFGLVRETHLAWPSSVVAAGADLQAIRERDPAATDDVIPFLFFKGFHAIQCHRVAHWLWRKNRRQLAHYIQSRASELFAVDIHPAAVLGRRILFDHGTGIVVGETCVIEDDVALLQNVTLGGTGKNGGDRHPKVRRGALIGSGAKVLGNIEVGEGARIGAGAVVLRPVPPFTTVVGNPARPVGRRHAELPALTMDQTLPPADYVI
ncbi:serine O-acetyltransferase [Gluconacetobacter johannae DSM 13595]|uniref:Serine acetyltransferase n=1 Tax=Gluconacetobacter johannae TaxID=112140 RepID=A0A7W4J8T8_9PROT|nr:serine O-acetyltransferase [Gluconacetobacter johannae]MBB2176808.1 serine O-acetyltransferase [Gluconacetobacter johannae]GBQ83924.1 serine O-acetyltransferase [Gluconacetobacter johannae DSM 13595]